ncbi:hypothetical protein BBK14_11300 [Parafrankia soli]|uniref:Uncharacterized protein n=1 Tax=Parafrankia soli TaxID=2599596 RepID=A0A1S1R7P8_9ACTN|nr:hypothetical protein [Parafrankia soli]OHV42200.1 hypothetical protein BBK14_11300 [Parafrankia soli]
MQTEQSADYVYGLTRELTDWWPRLVEMIDARTPPPAAVRTFGPRALSDTHDCGTPWAHAADSTPEKPRVYCPACTAGGTLPGYLRAPSTAAGSGGSPAPLRVSALDAVHTIRSGLLDLEIAVRDALGDEGWAAPAIYRDPNASVFQTTRYLGRQAPRIVALDTLTWTVDELRRLTGLLRAQVGTARQVRAIAGPCPICSTWSLRALLGREQIICTNPDCRCQQHDCSCTHGHPHTWRFHPDPTLDEWARLSVILDVELYGYLATDAA